MFIYITYDTDGFITAYQNIEADGFSIANRKKEAVIRTLY